MFYLPTVSNSNQIKTKPTSYADGAFSDAQRASLGSTANNPSAFANKASESLPRQNVEKYRELSHVQLIMSHKNILNTTGTDKHRTRMCHNTRHYMAEEIAINVATEPDSRKATLSGVQTCGCVWTCPVCSMRIAQQRAEEIRKALKWADENGYMAIMVTFTAKHNFKTRLREFSYKFKQAYTAWRDNGVFSRLKKKHGIKYLIKSVEITRGDNGWHYHYHVLMFVDKRNILKMQDADISLFYNKMANLWLKQLEKQGMSGVKEHALDLRIHGNVGAHYLTKLGVSDEIMGTNGVAELTNAHGKTRGGDTIWQIIRQARDDYRDGTKLMNQSARLYVEYAKAMTGQKWITWTPKFKDLVGVNDVDDEEIAEDMMLEAREPMEELMTISDKLFKPVRVFRKVADLLAIAGQTRDPKQVTQFLEELNFQWHKKQWERMKEQIMKDNKDAVKFKAEMASTPDLARMCRNLKDEIKLHKDDLYKMRDTGDPRIEKVKSAKRKCERHYHMMVKILKSRQLSLF